MKKKYKHKLGFTSSTWSKESNELFDYESSDITKTDYEIESAGSISRNHSEVSFISQSLNETITPIKNEFLFTVDSNENNYYLNTNQSNCVLKEKTWISLRGFTNKQYNNGYLLSPGDLIKFGRVCLKIREIQIEGKSKANIYDIYKECTKPGFQLSNKPTMIKRTCRICYCDDKEVESPLINPCKCSGGLKYIHLSCLQHWLKSQAVLVTTSNDNCTVYTFNQIECELCTEIFPDFVKIDMIYYPIWDFTTVKFKNYIAFESIPINGKKSIYVASFDKKNLFKIGRSHESDLRITDVTVSRLHAQIINRQDGRLVLEDSSSKFGSLIYLHLKKVPVYFNQVLPLQVGRSYFVFSMKESWYLCPCFNFLRPKNKNEDKDYCLLNANEIIIDKILSVKIQMNIYDDELEPNSESLRPYESSNIKEQTMNDMVQSHRLVEEMNTLNCLYENKKNNLSYCNKDISNHRDTEGMSIPNIILPKTVTDKANDKQRELNT